MHVRRSYRFPMQGVIDFAADDQKSRGALINLSTGGCAVESETVLQKGDYLELLVQLQNSELSLRVDLAAVRWSTGREYGLEFIRVRDETQKLLRSLLQAELSKTAPSAQASQTTSTKR